MKAKIAPALRELVLPIDAVEVHPANTYREHDLGAIGQSYRRFGQLRPLVAQRTDGLPRIVAGRGQYLAARQLGWESIAVAVHELTDLDAMAFIAADNRTAALGTDNTDALAELLSELAQAGNLKGTGYDGDDVDRILADLERDRGELDPGRAPAGADDQGLDVESQYAVAVLCASEAHQREVFEKLAAEGYACKVLAV